MIQALVYIVFLKKAVLLFTVPTGPDQAPPHTNGTERYHNVLLHAM